MKSFIILFIVTISILFSCSKENSLVNSKLGIDYSKFDLIYFKDSTSSPIIKYYAKSDILGLKKQENDEYIRGSIFYGEKYTRIYINDSLIFEQDTKKYEEDRDKSIHSYPFIFSGNKRGSVTKIDLIQDGRYYSFLDTNSFWIELQEYNDTLFITGCDFLPMYD